VIRVDQSAGERVISEIWFGGQTGVDRAAHDAALEAGVPIRGWLPHGRWAEDGPVPDRYAALIETRSDDVAVRTEWNVRDSDATLILTMGAPKGGTELTRRLAVSYGRPVLVIDLEAAAAGDAAARALEWCATLPSPLRLNVAGPRASKAPGIYPIAKDVVRRLLPTTR
jgi:hypothetical protein